MEKNKKYTALDTYLALREKGYQRSTALERVLMFTRQDPITRRKVIRSILKSKK